MSENTVTPEAPAEAAGKKRAWWEYFIPVAVSVLTLAGNKVFEGNPCDVPQKQNVYLLRKLDSTNNSFSIFLQSYIQNKTEKEMLKHQNDSLKNVQQKYLPPARLILKEK